MYLNTSQYDTQIPVNFASDEVPDIQKREFVTDYQCVLFQNMSTLYVFNGNFQYTRIPLYFVFDWRLYGKFSKNYLLHCNRLVTSGS